MFCTLQFVWILGGVGVYYSLLVRGLAFLCDCLICYSCFGVGFWLFVLVVCFVDGVSYWFGDVLVLMLI